ncbi:hypothetical protein LUQ84_003025 [Hamiltosporidium tvaerminnensis]|nr:hypothetical protein LUQ84_003025 [Hamiltosporidium tvaerminnensis]
MKAIGMEQEQMLFNQQVNRVLCKLDQNRINNNIVVTTYSLAERTLIQPSILPEFDNDNSLRILNLESSNSHRNNICVLKLEFKYIFMLLIENTLFISLSVMSNNNDIFTIVFSLYYMIIIFIFYKYMRGSKDFNYLVFGLSIFFILVNIFMLRIFLNILLKN